MKRLSECGLLVSSPCKGFAGNEETILPDRGRHYMACNARVCSVVSYTLAIQLL